MPISIDFSGDFSQVVDTLEPVVVARRRGERVAIDRAWRFSSATSEAEPSGGVVTATDVTWQLEWPAAEPPPRLGDRVIDAQGERFAVLRIERLAGNTRWRLVTRNLSLAAGLAERVTIEEAEWSGTPATITAWHVVDTAVPAHIQPQPRIGDLSTAPPTESQDFRVTIDTPVSLYSNHRLVTADGTVYRVRELHDVGRIDRLPVAVCEK